MARQVRLTCTVTVGNGRPLLIAPGSPDDTWLAPPMLYLRCVCARSSHAVSHSVRRPDSWPRAGPVSPDDVEAEPFILREEQPADEVTAGAVVAQGMRKPRQRRPPPLPHDVGWVCDHLYGFSAAQRGSTAGHGAPDTVTTGYSAAVQFAVLCSTVLLCSLLCCAVCYAVRYLACPLNVPPIPRDPRSLGSIFESKVVSSTLRQAFQDIFIFLMRPTSASPLPLPEQQQPDPPPLDQQPSWRRKPRAPARYLVTVILMCASVGMLMPALPAGNCSWLFSSCVFCPCCCVVS